MCLFENFEFASSDIIQLRIAQLVNSGTLTDKAIKWYFKYLNIIRTPSFELMNNNPTESKTLQKIVNVITSGVAEHILEKGAIDPFNNYTRLKDFQKMMHSIHTTDRDIFDILYGSVFTKIVSNLIFSNSDTWTEIIDKVLRTKEELKEILNDPEKKKDYSNTIRSVGPMLTVERQHKMINLFNEELSFDICVAMYLEHKFYPMIK